MIDSYRLVWVLVATGTQYKAQNKCLKSVGHLLLQIVNDFPIKNVQ